MRAWRVILSSRQRVCTRAHEPFAGSHILPDLLAVTCPSVAIERLVSMIEVGIRLPSRQAGVCSPVVRGIIYPDRILIVVVKGLILITARAPITIRSVRKYSARIIV